MYKLCQGRVAPSVASFGDQYSWGAVSGFSHLSFKPRLHRITLNPDTLGFRV